MKLFLSNTLKENKPVHLVAAAKRGETIGDATFVVKPGEEFLGVSYQEIYDAVKENGHIQITG